MSGEVPRQFVRAGFKRLLDSAVPARFVLQRGPSPDSLELFGSLPCVDSSSFSPVVITAVLAQQYQQLARLGGCRPMVSHSLLTI